MTRLDHLSNASHQPALVRGYCSGREHLLRTCTGAVLVTTLALAGCAPADAIATVATVPVAPPVLASPLDDEEPVSTPPVWDSASQARATLVAGEAFTAFTAQGLTQAEWWANFSPYLTPVAARAYSSVLVENIPALVVTGDPAPAGFPRGRLVTLEVSTDVGTYQIQLSRLNDTAPWLVERINARSEQS